MARREVAIGILLLIVVVPVDSDAARGNLVSFDKRNDVEVAKPPGGTVKTIQSGEDGDIIDCVDIYKQPAFDHPLLKNHTVQMKPSSFHEEEDEDHHQWLEGQPRLEDWSVDCPEGTVPIIRKTSKNGPDVKDHPNRFKEDAVEFEPSPGHEYAQVSLIGTKGSYHGARARHNVWTPYVESPGEISVSQIWVLAGHAENLNSVEAGWIVGLDSEPKQVTRFFTYWTSNGYQSTGCYNVRCPGFVQMNKGFGPGFIVHPVSTYNGKQFEVPIEIKQDLDTGNWWLRVMNADMGYWPGELFPDLRGGASAISWGGEIANGHAGSAPHTKTQMGSGHFPRDGYYTKSACILQIGHAQGTGPMQPTPRGDLVEYVTKRQCYDLVKGPQDRRFGTHIYFGGPGLSQQCPS